MMAKYQRPALALSIYPLYSFAYQSSALDEYNQGHFKLSKQTLEQYAKLYSRDPLALNFIGDTYVLMNDERNALKYYNLTLTYNPLAFSTVKSRYLAEKNLYGKEIAAQSLYDYLHSEAKIQESYLDDDTALFHEWCKQEQLMCPDTDSPIE